MSTHSQHASKDRTPRDSDEEKPEAPDRSLLVEWEGDSDSLDPRVFAPMRKWFYLTAVSMGSLLVTCTSSLYTMIYEQLMSEFGCSLELCNLDLSLYLFGMAFGPLLFGLFDQFYGRKPVYVTSTAFFPVWLIPVATAQNIQTILAARFLGGLSGSAFLTVAAGTIVDMFVPQQLLIPMTIFSGASFVGPALGPIMGGFISSFTDWRWCFYVQIIWAACILIAVLLTPGTFHPVLLSRKAAKLRKETGDDGYYAAVDKVRAGKTLGGALAASLTVPFKVLFQDPMIAVLSTYTALLQVILYLCFSAFPLVFGDNHGFNLWQIGLTFVPLAIGNVIACFCNPLWHNQWIGSIAKAKVKYGPDYKPQPELRLPPAMVGGPLLTSTLVWFAFTTYSSVYWIVPLVAMIFFSTAFFFLLQGIFTFLTAAYPKYAASVMCVNTTTRCLLAAAFPLFTDHMYHKLGYQWASALVAFLTLAMAPWPFVFYKYGPTLRAKSKFSHT